MSIKKARLEWLLNLFILAIVIGVVLGVMSSFANTKRDIFIPSNAFYPFYFFFAVFLIAPIIMIITGLNKICFILWTFDRTSQQIIKITTNLLGKTHTSIFSFQEVQSIRAEEDHDLPHTVTELYMMLKSEKKLTLNVSSYAFKDSEKIDNLKYHQLIAEKMCHQIGL